MIEALNAAEAFAATRLSLRPFVVENAQFRIALLKRAMEVDFSAVAKNSDELCATMWRYRQHPSY
jgi:hypothetical protein